MIYNKIISVMPSAFNYNNYFNNTQLKDSVCKKIGAVPGFNEHYDNFEVDKKYKTTDLQTMIKSH
jgi:hypothetical protein